MSDPVFDEEQAHLSQVYAKLEAIRDSLTREIEVTHREAAQDLRDMSEEVRLNFSSADETMETLAAIETLNSVIDAYNQNHDFTVDKLRRTIALLAQPYFAKVRLQMRPGRPARDVYIGLAGVTDENRRPLIVDWRSPIAETYYNQQMGPTSYQVDGRTRNVSLELRRQFDITRDHLNGYFDTTVAIEDSLLLGALRRHHTEKLQAITATIQREQNEVVRHSDVPVLLVNGIAGSGKTSVLLQRIAFLFYGQRDTLRADQVVLLSPNDVFARYIDAVLPSLGESNPQIMTWREWVSGLGLADRASGADVDSVSLRALEEGLPSLALEEQDFREVREGGLSMLKASSIAASVRKFERFGVGPKLMTLVREDLRSKLERRITQISKNDELQEEMLGLDVERQVEVFGETIAPSDERETDALARRYAEFLYGGARKQIDDASWLRLDRVGMRLTGGRPLSAAEYLYLKILVTGTGDDDVRYVMVDEVQDYTQTQLMVLARYFPRAHFLLLGDQHQAIVEGSAGFGQIREVFAETHGVVEECRLLTSYRSSPEITELFCSLLPPEERVTLSSVQRPGVEPVIRECPADAEAYLPVLRRAAENAHDKEGLCAIVAQDGARANWIARQLGDLAPLVGKGDTLPKEGVVTLDLRLAKGLEFDSVIIPDAQAEVYPDEPLARRRLYTAASRAMHEVTILSQGQMTPLLSPYLASHQGKRD